MGWDGWTTSEKHIDERQVREITDAMVTSGMRDTGREYVVIDDAWMAPERDGNDRLNFIDASFSFDWLRG